MSEGGFLKLLIGLGRAAQALHAKLKRGDTIRQEQAAFGERSVNDLVKSAHCAVKHAHSAVLGSPNEPRAQDDHRAAVIEGSAVCRSVYGAFAGSPIDGRLPYMLSDAITSFREAVTNDDNLNAVTQEMRGERERAITEAMQFLEFQIRSAAFRQMGVGTGKWTGQSRARGAPERD